MAVTSQSTLKELVDETTVIKNDLVSCRNTLKTNLSDKGVDTSALNKMGELINSIPSMPVKVFAKGTCSVNLNFVGDSSVEREKINHINTNLNFVPSEIIVKLYLLESSTSAWVYENFRISSKEKARIYYFSNPGIRFEIRNITKTGFDIVTVIEGSSLKVVRAYATEWYAFE